MPERWPAPLALAVLALSLGARAEPPKYPKEARQTYRLGRQLMERRDFRAAVGQFQSAEELDPGFAETHWALGFCFAKLNGFADAAREYQLYLDLEPRGPHARQVKDELPRLLRRAKNP